MMDIEKAVEFAVRVATDDRHGYSQARRTISGDTTYLRDVDCSALVISALKHAGFDTGPATFTGNMLTPLINAGFKDVTSSVNLRTGSGLQRGDILLRPKTASRGGHTALSLGDGRIVHAVSDYDKLPGDSSGQEIRIQAYYDSPYKYVLRHAAQSTRELRLMSPYMRGDDVRQLQQMLTDAGYPCGAIDGVYGPMTAKAHADWKNPNYSVAVACYRLNVREEPNNTSRILKVLKTGEKLKISQEQKPWGKLADQPGWIHLGYTNKL